MGNSQSGPVKTKYPSHAALPPPPSPFLHNAATTAQGQEKSALVESVVRRLVAAMSMTSISSGHLSATFLLVAALLGTKQDNDRLDVRVMFAEEEHFSKAFPSLSGTIRDDLISMADIVNMATPVGEEGDVDGEYYVLARVLALQNPNLIFAVLLSVCLEGFSVEWSREEIGLVLGVVEAVLAVLKTCVRAMQTEDCDYIAVFPSIHTMMKKYEFVGGVLSLIVQNYDIIRKTKPISIMVDDYEVSSFNMFMSVVKQLYLNHKLYGDCLSLSVQVESFYERHSLAILPLVHLTFIQCLCYVHLNDTQSAISYGQSLEQSVSDLNSLMTEMSVNGSVVGEFLATAEHFNYFLMCTALTASHDDLVIHFARSANHQSTTHSHLTLVTSTMCFVTLLKEHRWSEAYASINKVSTGDARRDCMKRFLVVLLESGDEKNVGAVLCSLPFCEHYDVVEETLLTMAKTSAAPSAKSDFLHKLLFTFYMHHGDYRGAAGAMFRLASKTNDMVMKRRYFLLTVTCLELISTDFQWIAITDDGACIDNYNGGGNGRQLFMYSIDDIRSMMSESSPTGSYDGHEHVNGVIDEAGAVSYAQPFVERDDNSLLQNLRSFDYKQQLAILARFGDKCEWLKQFWRQSNVNHYLLHHQGEVKELLDSHIDAWRQYRKHLRLGITVGRPVDLLSAGFYAKEHNDIDDDLHDRYYNEYIPLTIDGNN